MGSILGLKETYSNCCFEFIVALTYRVRYVEHFDIGSSFCCWEIYSSHSRMLPCSVTDVFVQRC